MLMRLRIIISIQRMMSFISINSKPFFLLKSFKEKKSLNLKKKDFQPLFFANFKKINFKNSSLFIEQVILRNEYSNLISKKTIYSIYRKHFLDTLTIELFLNSFRSKKEATFCLDVGTGGGFPGLLLSFFSTKFFFLLIESIKKKTLFHQKIYFFLESSNCKSLCSRAEIIGKSVKHRAVYDIVLARGVSEIHYLIWFSFPLLSRRGKIIISKQISKINEEISESKADLQRNKGKLKAIFNVSSVKKGRIIIMIKSSGL